VNFAGSFYQFRGSGRFRFPSKMNGVLPFDLKVRKVFDAQLNFPKPKTSMNAGPFPFVNQTLNKTTGFAPQETHSLPPTLL